MNRKTIINGSLGILWKAIFALFLCIFVASCSKEDVITEETGITGTPRFIWDIAIELEQPNNWCMTLAIEKVSITNLTEGKQYILTWKGGLSTGQKTDGILKTVIRGEQTKKTDLDLLEIKESGNNTYEIFLRGDGRKGEIVFTK
ncbi:hypothetical protein [Bacteroides sp. D2]|uniref:hypothetical protein n=1 Tax=Bacteroides sp. D2 TaxID=556259 RepID=UPI0001BC856F|nr:hypothetical protein [Bacteroides sp. D2]EFS30708.1 hypothetical protein BSGG_1408 [Bacteroides sp. D2]UWO01928.1 hypothetical protein NQ505_11025 [Bacteroides sp. D2]